MIYPLTREQVDQAREALTSLETILSKEALQKTKPRRRR
jgi:hypothetical protein